MRAINAKKLGVYDRTMYRDSEREWISDGAWAVKRNLLLNPSFFSDDDSIAVYLKSDFVREISMSRSLEKFDDKTYVIVNRSPWHYKMSNKGTMATALYDDDGAFLAVVKSHYLDTIDNDGILTWWGKDDISPLFATSGSDNVVAIVMPISIKNREIEELNSFIGFLDK